MAANDEPAIEMAPFDSDADSIPEEQLQSLTKEGLQNHIDNFNAQTQVGPS
jgi:hypothetical protein